MANGIRNIVVALAVGLAVCGVGGQARAATGSVAAAAPSRVRSDNLQITAIIRDASARSATFRALVETIDASDGLVYVQQGRCGHGVRACLMLSVIVAGPNRLLRIVVDTNKADWDLMGSIAHELRHAIEVLSDPSVTRHSDIFFFYRKAGMTSAGRFETEAAIAAGDAVRAEVRTTASTAERSR